MHMTLLSASFLGPINQLALKEFFCMETRLVDVHCNEGHTVQNSKVCGTPWFTDIYLI